MKSKKTLIIVESPTKAEKIGKLLGDKYIVIASCGHICDLAKGGKYGIGVDILNDFKAKYVLLEDKTAILQSIIDAAEKADEILLFSDPDREGMAIAYHIMRYIKSLNKPIKRGLIYEITKKGLDESLKNLSDIDMNLFKSQEARRILDRIVGFMVSPLLLNYYGPNLSAGRVQSVAVRMIADREHEIDVFKPEEFWNIFCKLKNQNNEQFTAKVQGRFPNKDAVDTVITTLNVNDAFYVSKILNQKKNETPCAPMTTSTLQQYMAKKFSFEPERTMKIAQNLYESGFVTYIRTDSTRSSEESIQSVRDHIKVIGFDVPKKPNVFESKESIQDAHECIRPTNVRTEPNAAILSGDDREVYAAIWQHFVGSQMNPAIWNTMRVTITCKNDPKIQLYVSGKALEYKGCLEIFGPVDLGKIDIPNLQEGDVILLSGKSPIKTEQKHTQPPPRFNVASIIKELEERQIGRPATYAEIIKKISLRNYVEKVGNAYKPTDLGKKITNVLVEYFPFMEYSYTAKLEKQLDEIASGNVNSVSMLKEFFVPFKLKLDQAYTNNGCIFCDKCNSPMVTRTNSKDQTKFMACSGWPKCYNTKPFDDKTN